MSHVISMHRPSDPRGKSETSSTSKICEVRLKYALLQSRFFPLGVMRDKQLLVICPRSFCLVAPRFEHHTLIVRAKQHDRSAIAAGFQQSIKKIFSQVFCEEKFLKNKKAIGIMLGFPNSFYTFTPTYSNEICSVYQKSVCFEQTFSIKILPI